MEFKRLELEKEGSWIKRTFLTPHIIRSLSYAAVFALGSFLLFYYSEGRHMEVLAIKDVLKSLAIGGFFGFFITNSPCARGRC